jgi:uncharacterized membrane protein YqhA
MKPICVNPKINLMRTLNIPVLIVTEWAQVQFLREIFEGMLKTYQQMFVSHMYEEMLWGYKDEILSHPHFQSLDLPQFGPVL